MKRLLPPHLLVLTALVMIVLHATLPNFPVVASPWNWLGLPFLIGGGAISFAGARLFKTAGTNIMTFGNPDQLVTTGLFTYSRNPMYLGMGAAIAGLAVLLGTAAPLLLAAVFCVILDRWYVQFEEMKMLQTFGSAYRDYQKAVRRWI